MPTGVHYVCPYLMCTGNAVQRPTSFGDHPDNIGPQCTHQTLWNHRRISPRHLRTICEHSKYTHVHEAKCVHGSTLCIPPPHPTCTCMRQWNCHQTLWISTVIWPRHLRTICEFLKYLRGLVCPQVMGCQVGRDTIQLTRMWKHLKPTGSHYVTPVLCVWDCTLYGDGSNHH